MNDKVNPWVNGQPGDYSKFEILPGGQKRYIGGGYRAPGEQQRWQAWERTNNPNSPDYTGDVNHQRFMARRAAEAAERKAKWDAIRAQALTRSLPESVPPQAPPAVNTPPPTYRPGQPPQPFGFNPPPTPYVPFSPPQQPPQSLPIPNASRPNGFPTPVAKKSLL